MTNIPHFASRSAPCGCVTHRFHSVCAVEMEIVDSVEQSHLLKCGKCSLFWIWSSKADDEKVAWLDG